MDLVSGGDFSFMDAVIDISISTDATGGYTDGVLTLPGLATDSVNVRFDWAQRLAEYNNELGVVVADSADGVVSGINPSDDGYAQALLRSPSRRTIFASGAAAGDSAEFAFSGGDSLVSYLVQNAMVEDWLRINPTNDVAKRPVVFFSTLNANPDSFNPAPGSPVGVGIVAGFYESTPALGAWQEGAVGHFGWAGRLSLDFGDRHSSTSRWFR